MTTVKTKLVLALIATLSMLSFNSEAYAHMQDDSFVLVQSKKDKEDFKHGQYVYVTLKDGSQTVGKIVGKRSAKKYYVNQLDGSHHGVVNKKYIRKMTKQEIENYKSQKNSN